MAWQCTAVAAALWQYGGDADNNKKAHSPWGWRAKKAIGHGRNPIVFLRKKTDNNDYKKQQQQQKGPWGFGKEQGAHKKEERGPPPEKKIVGPPCWLCAPARAPQRHMPIKRKTKRKDKRLRAWGVGLPARRARTGLFSLCRRRRHGQPPSKKVGCRGKGVKGRLGTHPLQTTTATARTRRTTRLFLSLKKRNKKTKELAKEDHEQKDRTRRLRQPGKKKQEQNKGKHTRHARRREHGEARRVARGQGRISGAAARGATAPAAAPGADRAHARRQAPAQQRRHARGNARLARPYTDAVGRRRAPPPQCSTARVDAGCARARPARAERGIGDRRRGCH